MLARVCLEDCRGQTWLLDTAKSQLPAHQGLCWHAWEQCAPVSVSFYIHMPALSSSAALHADGAGVVPMLAALGSGNNDTMLQEAVAAATKRGLVRPHDHVVCVMSIKDSLVVKVVTMDSIGARCMRHTDSLQGEMQICLNCNFEPHHWNCFICVFQVDPACLHQMSVQICTIGAVGQQDLCLAGSEADLSQIGSVADAAKSGAVLAPEIKLDSSPIPSRISAPI